jgi:hypothetical protein
MILLSSDLAPALAAILVAAVAWFIRTQSRARHETRVAQLRQATALIHQQAEASERFLASPAAPIDLKALLVAFNDAMADRASVEKWAIWAASRPSYAPIELAGTEALAAQLATLRHEHAELAEDFTTAVFSAAMGASLRWPETAKLFDRMFPHLLTTPGRDVVMAVTATGFQSAAPAPAAA